LQIGLRSKSFSWQGCFFLVVFLLLAYLVGCFLVILFNKGANVAAVFRDFS